MTAIPFAAISPDSFENLTQDQPVPDSALYMCKLMIKMTIIKHAPWDLKYLGYDLPGRLNESVKYGGDGDLSYFNWSDLAFTIRSKTILLSPPAAKSASSISTLRARMSRMSMTRTSTSLNQARTGMS